MPLHDREMEAMGRDELLDIVIEEASEIIKAACKIKRFGYAGSHPDRNETNIEALAKEGEACGASVRILAAKEGLNYGETVAARGSAAEAEVQMNRRKAVAPFGKIESHQTR